VNKNRPLAFLKNQDPSTLLPLLEAAFDTMTTNQRREVFGKLDFDGKASNVDRKNLLNQVKKFYDDSLEGIYYAPFEVNSKNYMDIPEETEEWFEKLGDLLGDATKVSETGSHQLAVDCFRILYELIEKIDEGEEIVFADELGSWMIPADERSFLKAYLQSLSAVSNPEELTEAVIPLLKRDSHQSLSGKIYKSAIQVADKEQKKALQAAIKSEKVKVK